MQKNIKQKIRDIESHIQTAENYKNQIINIVQSLLIKYQNGEISIQKYNDLILSKLDGKSSQEWINYYDDYINTCKIKISNYKNQLKKNSFKQIFIATITLFFYLFIILIYFPAFSNVPTTENTLFSPPIYDSFSQEINITFTFSNSYLWTLENPGQLASVSLSGYTNETGVVQIYLNDLLIINTISQNFSNTCEETCNLSNHNLTNSEYNLRIEVNNSSLTLSEIQYEIIEPFDPQSQIEKTEINTYNGKKVKLSGPENLKNQKVSTKIPNYWKINKHSSLKVFWEENNSYVDHTTFDSDNDGIIDSIEWTVPHFSNQTFLIIVITNAEHLDRDRIFISDIYSEVKELDNIWSEEIPNGDYIRVTFEENLTSENDISIYLRKTTGNPKIQIFEYNESILIAELNNPLENSYNKIFLDNLEGIQDKFDILISSGSVEIDHIIDPIVLPGGSVELRAQTCFEQNQQTSQNNFPDPCFGTYPASCPTDRLSCDDSQNEVAIASKSGPTTTYGGVKVRTFNNAITDCVSITQVRLCYEFWGSNKHHTCTIGVDNDGDDTFVDRPAPICLSTSPPGLNCVDVTSDEAWICSNFFESTGTRATAKAQAIRTGGSSIQSWNFDSLFFEVTYAGNAPPTIVTPPSISPVTLTTGGNQPVTFSFTAEDLDGASDLDASTITASFTKSGKPERSIIDGLNDGPGLDECTILSETLPNQRTYTCQITMRYYDDNAADWSVTVSIDDFQGATTQTSQPFTVALLQEITLSPSTINFPKIVSPSSNIPSSTNTIITNLGNWDSTTDGDVKITAYALSINPHDGSDIPAANFRAGDESESGSICDAGGQPLIQATAQSISSIVLPRGEPTFNTGTITYCLDTVPSGLTSGATYSTSGTSPNTQQWIISIALAVFTIKRKRKKKTKLSQENLLDKLDEELQENYNISLKELLPRKTKKLPKTKIDIPISIFKQKLSPSEAICKFLKENKNLKLNEIANLLNRDQRTIWINYRNASNKKKNKLTIENKNLIPINIFNNRKLSILESLIHYLKEKHFTNIQIANLLKKDTRNIWTIYSRALKKLNI